MTTLHNDEATETLTLGPSPLEGEGSKDATLRHAQDGKDSGAASSAPTKIEALLKRANKLPSAHVVSDAIQRKMVGMGQVHARMDADEALYNLEDFVPDFEESIAPEDAYTTNAPRVLAEKTVAFELGSGQWCPQLSLSKAPLISDAY